MLSLRSAGSLPLALSLFVWAGLVAGISFIEAPLKFTAPHITVPLGLGIGCIVFAALNEVALALAAAALLSAAGRRRTCGRRCPCSALCC